MYEEEEGDDRKERLTQSGPRTFSAGACSPSISHAGFVTKAGFEKGGRLIDRDACPNLVCYGVEKRSLVCVLEVLDGVEILERTGRGYRVLRHTVAKNKTWSK